MSDLVSKLHGAYKRLRQLGRLTAGRLFGTLPTTSGRYLAIMGMEESDQASPPPQATEVQG